MNRKKNYFFIVNGLLLCNTIQYLSTKFKIQSFKVKKKLYPNNKKSIIYITESNDDVGYENPINFNGIYTHSLKNNAFNNINNKSFYDIEHNTSNNGVIFKTSDNKIKTDKKYQIKKMYQLNNYIFSGILGSILAIILVIAWKQSDSSKKSINKLLTSGTKNNRLLIIHESSKSDCIDYDNSEKVDYVVLLKKLVDDNYNDEEKEKALKFYRRYYGYVILDKYINDKNFSEIQKDSLIEFLIKNNIITIKNDKYYFITMKKIKPQVKDVIINHSILNDKITIFNYEDDETSEDNGKFFDKDFQIEDLRKKLLDFFSNQLEKCKDYNTYKLYNKNTKTTTKPTLREIFLEIAPTTIGN